MNRLIQQYCSRATSVSCEKLCQFIVDLIRCRMMSASWTEMKSVEL